MPRECQRAARALDEPRGRDHARPRAARPSRMLASAASTARKLTRVEHEADPGAGRGDDQARDRGADHARAVEEPGVQRHGVRQLARPDELERQRLPRRGVEGERDAAERGEHVDDGQRRRPGERDHGEDDRDAIAAACVAITSRRESTRSATTPATRPKTVNGTKRQNASAPMASGRSGELEHEPGERDVLHPRARPARRAAR